MKNILAAIFITLLGFSAFSQKSPIKYGEIPMEDMTMTTYPQDSSAVAVILADYGNAYVTISLVTASLIFERHVRIKILKKEGLRWADAAIPVFHVGASEERVSSLKASTYNLEGGKIVETKMSKEGTFKEKFNRNINLMKFTLPGVREGSVLEYSYTINSEFLTNFPNWQFQYNIPVRWSEYWASIPDFFVMEKYMQGYVPATVYEVKDKPKSNYSDKTYHWVIQHVPAFIDEPFMTSENDYVSKINFALAYINFPGQPSHEVMGSWEKLNQQLLDSDHFGRTITGSGFLKKKAEELIAGETDPMKKIEKIYNYIKETLEWNGVNDFLADNLKEVFDSKKGTTGDINLALASMLEKVGIEVDMLLVSTRDHGFIRQQYPMTKQFNYVVCVARVDGRPVLLDATERYLPAGVIPERCLNGVGLMISKRFHGWLPLQTKTKDKTFVQANLALNPSGNLNGSVSYAHDGYAGSNMRKQYFSQGESDYIKSTIGRKTSWQISNSTFDNLNDITKAGKEMHEVAINDHATTAGTQIYLNPFVTEQLQKNPFTLEARTYPVDYGSLKEKIYMAKITLPDGYEIDELPQSKVLAFPGNAAKYTYSISQVGNAISILSNFQINRNIFLQDEYPVLREFYNQVVAKQAEQIVLKKKQ
ncbi:MAG: DUF3857 domain-containing protein [Cyclobacteriaceae bacterium]